MPWLGKGGIFERYLSPNLIEGGKGIVQACMTLEQKAVDIFEYIAHAGIGNVSSGFYLSDDNQIQLFINLGAGAVIYEGLPSANGKLTFDYYGDAVGLRSFELTPYHIQAELLNDLNEAFKMLTQQME